MPAISPRTMSFSGGPPSADQARPLFEQGLTQMAYDVLIAKLPHISQDVVTFKIIDVDPDAGSGSGAFVVRRQGQTLYVPVVMADNQIKPLDVFYHKGLNVFLPLTKDWLEQIDRASLTEMGQGAKPPQSLSKDVDIRQVVVPPVTGRFSYASDYSAEKNAAVVFDQARLTKTSSRPVFLEYLTLAPNRIKKAAALVFERNPRILKAAVRTYGSSKLAAAFRELPEKRADYGGHMSRGGALYVLDESSSSDAFKNVFGPQAPMAYQQAVTRGYAAVDQRPTKRAVRTVHAMKWTSPGLPGAYKFVTVDGKPVLAVAFTAPVQLFHRTMEYGSRHSNVSRRGEPRFKGAIAITEDGVCVKGQLPVAEQLQLGDLQGSRLFREMVSGEPRVGAKGVFVRLNSRGLSATEPVKIKSISTDSSGARRVVVTEPAYDYFERELITPAEGHNDTLMVPKGERVAFLPASFKFVNFVETKAADDAFALNAESVQRMVDDALIKVSAEQHAVRFSPQHGWTFGSSNRRGMKFAEAIEAVARHTQIHVDVAASIVKEAADSGRAVFWAVPEMGARQVERFLKVAAGPAQPGPQDAPPPGDPAQGGPPPGPPPMPTPVDMAVAEQTQSIMGQIQSLQQQLNLLQMVQQRSQQIAGVGPAGAPEAMAAAMGGPAPTPQAVNPMLAGPGPQMDPSQMGGGQQGQMQPQGGQPGMPQQGGPQGQMGMPPDPMSGGQGPVDPQTGMPIDPQTGQPMEPPPPAMMSAEPGTPEDLAAQVNPQFMEQASELQDAGAFDAAALASMAQSPSVRDLIAAYVPNLERALDNLGRIMVTLYLDEARIKEQVGNETFVALEDNLRNTFKGLGDLLLKINQNAVTMQTTTPFGNSA